MRRLVIICSLVVGLAVLSPYMCGYLAVQDIKRVSQDRFNSKFITAQIKVKKRGWLQSELELRLKIPVLDANQWPTTKLRIKHGPIFFHAKPRFALAQIETTTLPHALEQLTKMLPALKLKQTLTEHSWLDFSGNWHQQFHIDSVDYQAAAGKEGLVHWAGGDITSELYLRRGHNISVQLSPLMLQNANSKTTVGGLSVQSKSQPTKWGFPVNDFSISLARLATDYGNVLQQGWQLSYNSKINDDKLSASFDLQLKQQSTPLKFGPLRLKLSAENLNPAAVGALYRAAVSALNVAFDIFPLVKAMEQHKLNKLVAESQFTSLILTQKLNKFVLFQGLSQLVGSGFTLRLDELSAKTPYGNFHGRAKVTMQPGVPFLYGEKNLTDFVKRIDADASMVISKHLFNQIINALNKNEKDAPTPQGIAKELISAKILNRQGDSYRVDARISQGMLYVNGKSMLSFADAITAVRQIEKLKRSS